jgi:hypothetical protein
MKYIFYIMIALALSFQSQAIEIPEVLISVN